MAVADPEGDRLPLGDQESVGGDAQRGVMVEAAPSAPFIMAEPDLLLEFLIVALSGKELARCRTLRLGPSPVPPHKNHS